MTWQQSRLSVILWRWVENCGLVWQPDWVIFVRSLLSTTVNCQLLRQTRWPRRRHTVRRWLPLQLNIITSARTVIERKPAICHQSPVIDHAYCSSLWWTSTPMRHLGWQQTPPRWSSVCTLILCVLFIQRHPLLHKSKASIWFDVMYFTRLQRCYACDTRSRIWYQKTAISGTCFMVITYEVNNDFNFEQLIRNMLYLETQLLRIFQALKCNKIVTKYNCHPIDVIFPMQYTFVNFGIVVTPC